MATFEWLDPTDSRNLIRIMSKTGGRRAEFLYELFADLNCKFFTGRLPTPLILSEITPYGKCLGSTTTGGEMTIPVIRIHPALCGHDGGINPDAWGESLFPHVVYSTMIHEMVHISQKLPGLADLTGETSHNAGNWVSECNRMAEAWDLPKCCRRWTVQRDGKKVARGPDMDEPTADTVVDGLTMGAVGTWPRGVARVVHRDVAGWAESCVRRLELPTF